jgi:hypothetical protein
VSAYTFLQFHISETIYICPVQVASVYQNSCGESLTENEIAMNGSAGIESLIRAFRG